MCASPTPELEESERTAVASTLGVGEVKFADQVLPSVKKVVYGVDFKRVFKGKLVLGIADGWLEADGVRIYEVKDMRVGLFQPVAG